MHHLFHEDRSLESCHTAEMMVRDEEQPRPVPLVQKVTRPPYLPAAELNDTFVKSLDGLIDHPERVDLGRKPLDLVVGSQLPTPIRCYLFTLTYSVSERQQGAYRCQLILPGHSGRSSRAHLDSSGGAFVLVGGFEPDLEVFTFWDAELHDRPGIPYSKGVQIKDTTLHAAALDGIAEQDRELRLSPGEVVTETVVAVRRDRVVEGLMRRWHLSVERLLRES